MIVRIAFIRTLGVEPGKKEIRRMRRKSMMRMTELLFSGKYVELCEDTFKVLFVDFFVEYLHRKRVY